MGEHSRGDGATIGLAQFPEGAAGSLSVYRVLRGEPTQLVDHRHLGMGIPWTELNAAMVQLERIHGVGSWDVEGLQAEAVALLRDEGRVIERVVE